MKNRILTILTLFVFNALWAQEPQSQPTNLSFFNVRPFGFNLAFTPSAADGFLVLRSSNGPVTFVPQDGVEYQKGQGVAPGVKVMSAASSPSFSVREVIAGRTYHFAIFAFNGSGVAADYLQNDPLVGSISVPDGGYGNYYASLLGGSPTFLNDLKIRLNTGRVFQSYTPGFLNNVMRNVYIRDTVGGLEVINCQYTGETRVYTPPLAWGTSAGSYSREHVLPQSWMPTTGGSTADQDRADYHNLLPANHINANHRRSNYPYGIVQTVTHQYLEGKLGTDGQGQLVYEPRDDIKGDVARAQFYMLVCYNGNNGTWAYSVMPSLAPLQNQDILKTWHIQDPPEPFEITKHEYIFSLQNNRNPFIDFPEWVDCIDFSTLTIVPGCAITLGNDEPLLSELSVSVYPNPISSGSPLTIQLPEESEAASVSLTSLFGGIVWQMNTHCAGSTCQIMADFPASGVYFISIRTKQGGSIIKKLVVNL